MNAGPGSGPTSGQDEGPPVLRGWRQAYLLVLAWLAVQVIFYALLSWVYR